MSRFCYSIPWSEYEMPHPVYFAAVLFGGDPFVLGLHGTGPSCHLDGAEVNSALQPQVPHVQTVQHRLLKQPKQCQPLCLVHNVLPS